MCIFLFSPLSTKEQVKVIKMIKVASIILLSVLSIALGEDEIELNENGCPKDNMVYKIMPHENCNQFYKCSNGAKIEFKCPEALAFNLNENVCDWPNHVDCGDRKTVSPAPETNDDDNDAASVCARNGSDGMLIAHEYCNHLYMCARGVPIDISCPDPLVFNTDLKLCDWENQVDCGDRLMEKESESQEK